MKTTVRLLTLAALLPLINAHLAAAPVGTAFTYQGRLINGTNPAQGIYDLRFTIYDALAGGSSVGGPLTNAATAVSNGLFTVTLDFGADVFDGNARWLEVGVRTNGGGAFGTLAPRQPLTPAPYAAYAPSAGVAASANSVAAANVTGTLGLAQLPGAAVTNNEIGLNLSGAFAGSGAGLTGVNADQLDGQHGAFYQNAGNLTSGTLADARLSASVALRSTTNTFTATNVFAKPVGIDCYAPGRPLQVGNPNTFGSVGIIRLASRSTNSADSRVWDIGVPQTGSDKSGDGYSFMIDDTQSGTAPEFLVHWGNGYVGIGRTNPVSALDVNGTVTATSFAGNASGLTSLNASQLAAGTVPLAQLPGTVVTNNATGLNLSGSFSGNGASVTNVNLATVNSQGAIGWAVNWCNFVLTGSPGVGNGPMSVVAADVNGDGNLELVCANATGNTLSVLTNNGSGRFAVASSISLDSAPYSVTAADVNGDGKTDLISANYGGNSLSVLTNNGSGGFVLAAALPVGASPAAVTAADVNGDGKTDLISANYGDNSLSVLTNNGSGGFGLAALPTVGVQPLCVMAADVNGDGKLDLISANWGANTLTVLTNNGSGGFVLAATLTVGAGPAGVTSADVNGDGKLDLISANPGYGDGNTLTVLTNNGSGGFGLAATLAVGAGAYSVAAADVNGDGQPDLISANYNADTLTVLTNNGSGGFAVACSPGVGGAPNCVVAADVNRDGRPDLISANYQGNTLSVLLNTPGYQADFQGGFTGNGAGLTGLNASQITSGIFSGNGGGLTNLSAANLTGPIADARLSTNIALLNANQVFTGANRFAGVATLTNAANAFAGAFTGNGGGLTNLNPANITGTIADGQLSANVALLNANQAFTGPNRFAGMVTLTNAANTLAGAFTGSSAGTFAGNGGGLTNVPGTLAWQTVAGTSQTAAANRAYLLTNNVQVTLTLPAAAGLGDVVRVSGTGAGGWKIAQNSGQIILAGSIPGNIGATWTARASSLNWVSVASSADGTKLAAVIYGGQIYTSSDSGATWTAHAISQQWASVTSSADGTKLVAVVYGGQIYTSSDSGATWTAHASNQNWFLVACSADGAKLVAAVQGGQIYTSSDSGVNWTARASSQYWTGLASSADGTRLVACVGTSAPGQIYTSSDSGVTWTAHAGSQYWGGVASSSDGSKLVAVVYGGQIYTSSDYGASWTAHASSLIWQCVASTPDGTKLVAAVTNGRIWTSTDSGVTWMACASARNWYSVACSADGTRLVGVVAGGQIYTSIPSTTLGAAGYLTGGQYGAIELQYVGNGQFLPLGHEGTILAY